MKYTVEITLEAFKSIVEHEKICFTGKEVRELYEKTYYTAKGMQLYTVVNFVSEIKQYYVVDINY